MNQNGSIPTGKLDAGRAGACRKPAPTAGAVQVAVPYAPPPTQGNSWVAAAICVFLLLIGSAGAGWYLLGRDADTGPDAKELTLAETSSPAPEPNVQPPMQSLPASKAENAPASAAAVEIKPPAEAPPALIPSVPKTAAPSPKLEPPPQIAAVKPAPKKALDARPDLADQEKVKVNAAIERGVRFLKKQQLATGTWRRDGYHALGYAALPGLTLLECQVPATDPVIRRAATFVRRAVPVVNDTYDLSLALLFLDRLGDKRDRALIQQIALRLVAAQTMNGGWTYEAFPLSKTDETDLMRFLRQTRPLAAQMSLPVASRSEDKSLVNPGGDRLPKSSRLRKSEEQERSKTDDAARSPTKTPTPAMAKRKPARPEALPPIVRRLAIANQGQVPGVPQAHGMWRPMFPVREDNSNSQFAMLALWAARRHDVPTERSLSLTDKRYHNSQNRDGGWGYHTGMGTTPAMTGVGLLGLAVGHASSDEGLRAAAQGIENKAGVRNHLQDPAIQAGLEAFARHIGGADDPVPTNPNLYLLWTVERVAMLYNLPTIGGKDWYRWGVRTLVPRQHDAGGWLLGLHIYPGEDVPIDTSFALLFLKRSNLVQDLTRNLTFYLAITDPASGAKRK